MKEINKQNSKYRIKTKEHDNLFNSHPDLSVRAGMGLLMAQWMKKNKIARWPLYTIVKAWFWLST